MRHYRHRVTIERPAPGKDIYGQETGGWAQVAEVWARIMPESGAETYVSGQVQAVERLRVETWFRPDVTPACRLRQGERVLEIESVTPLDAAGRRMILLCREKV